MPMSKSMTSIDRVYVLSASGGCGKTTTLNHLAHYLYALPARYRIGVGVSIPIAPPYHLDGQYWFDSIISPSKRVGICTAGDTNGIIKNAFSYFSKNSCSVCFIASRLWGQSLREIESQSATIGVEPQYLYLPTEHSVRTQSAVQGAVARFLESLI